MHSINDWGYSYYGEVRLGLLFILAPIGLGNWPQMFVNGPHVLNLHSVLCRIRDYCTVYSMWHLEFFAFGILSHSGLCRLVLTVLCRLALCRIWPLLHSDLCRSGLCRSA